MKTVYSSEHILRNAKTELTGGQLVTPYECPQRADYILAAIKGCSTWRNYCADTVAKTLDRKRT